jgi:hypothetical protein
MVMANRLGFQFAIMSVRVAPAEQEMIDKDKSIPAASDN